MALQIFQYEKTDAGIVLTEEVGAPEFKSQAAFQTYARKNHAKFASADCSAGDFVTVRMGDPIHIKPVIQYKLSILKAAPASKPTAKA